jgi:hypothetical protein
MDLRDQPGAQTPIAGLESVQRPGRLRCQRSWWARSAPVFRKTGLPLGLSRFRAKVHVVVVRARGPRGGGRRRSRLGCMVHSRGQLPRDRLAIALPTGDVQRAERRSPLINGAACPRPKSALHGSQPRDARTRRKRLDGPIRNPSDRVAFPLLFPSEQRGFGDFGQILAFAGKSQSGRYWARTSDFLLVRQAL